MRPQHKKALFNFLKIAVTLLALAYVAWKLNADKDTLWTAFAGLGMAELGLVLIAAFLVLANQGIEAYKWCLMMRRIYPELTYKTAVSAVLAGNTAAIVTPARVGEYAGRILYLPEGKRLEALGLTLMERIGQLMVTVWAGLFSAFFLLRLSPSLIPGLHLTPINYDFLLVLLATTISLTTCLYLFPQFLAHVLSRLTFRLEILEKLAGGLGLVHSSLVVRLLSLSLLRTTIFSAQYFLLLTAFGFVGQALLKLSLLTFVLFIKSIIPSIAFAELGVRETVAVALMSEFGVPVGTVLLATLCLYLINVALPAVAGLWFVGKMKV